MLTFSKGISLNWLEHNRDHIDNTAEFNTLTRLFPGLEEIFHKGRQKDPDEYVRTLIHTFQTQAAYNNVCSGEFLESGLEGHALGEVRHLAGSISLFSPRLMPTILWLHDIGRLEEKSRHNEKSAEMISEFGLLGKEEFSDEEALLIQKVVRYHLLIGTLYTGESSYTSFRPLMGDGQFQGILNNKTSLGMFLDSLTLFTIIDVWGYHIHDISSAMIDNYMEIRREMGEIFADRSDISGILKALTDKSRTHMDWRLMGYMMAFSKIGKKPHLTLKFYAGMVEDGFKRYAEREGLSIDWKDFKAGYLDKMDYVQFKYGLGVLIPLSYGGTGKKMHLTEQTRMNVNLFHLLVCINNRLSKEELTNSECIPSGLWDVVFKGYPQWNRKTNFHQKLNDPGLIEEIIDRGTISADKDEDLNRLTLDFGGFWQDE